MLSKNGTECSSENLIIIENILYEFGGDLREILEYLDTQALITIYKSVLLKNFQLD